ncbi:hypothetical protein SI65_05834 [Aspergillus cristatus]|uniref:Uncharacterized protein n=1 Tax=Aspergillus cristatus TaxID=573508 RepID=A0A1E3BE65_ASPCR|nr:hypothetical protein SI65_05834 [Aspergillus cristatus]
MASSQNRNRGFRKPALSLFGHSDTVLGHSIPPGLVNESETRLQPMSGQQQSSTTNEEPQDSASPAGSE